jgi:hypothetical protein
MGGLAKEKAPKKAAKVKGAGTGHRESCLLDWFPDCITNVV